MRVAQLEMNHPATFLVLDKVVGIGVERKIMFATHLNEFAHHLFACLTATFAVAVQTELPDASYF